MLNKEKALVGAFSENCENSTGDPGHELTQHPLVELSHTSACGSHWCSSWRTSHNTNLTKMKENKWYIHILWKNVRTRHWIVRLLDDSRQMFLFMIVVGSCFRGHHENANVPAPRNLRTQNMLPVCCPVVAAARARAIACISSHQKFLELRDGLTDLM